MNAPATEVFVSGLGYLEGARWHDGELWFSDIKNRTVNRVTSDGHLTVAARVEGRPSGIGFEPDGTPLVISMEGASLIRLLPSGQRTAATFGPGIYPNDMAVDAHGRAYISHHGFNLFGNERIKPTGIIIRHPDGRIEQTGDELTLPNGIAVSADGAMLVVAESLAWPRTRLSAFDITADGSLVNRRVFAQFESSRVDIPDGICIDRDNGVWVAICRGQFRRVVEGGEVTDVVTIPAEGGNFCVDCVIGGADYRTLYMLIANTTIERMRHDWDSSARVESIRVLVPGFDTSETADD